MIESYGPDPIELPPGPWRDEPHWVTWNVANGYRCAIRRHPILGHLCGYVAVPEHHHLHGARLGQTEDHLEVHGGVTFADWRDDMAEGDVWAIGFDCAHSGDTVPGLVARGLTSGVYRDFRYVEAEVVHLAQQLAEIRGGRS